MTAFWSGAAEEAEAAFSETVSAGEPTGFYGAEIYALGYLAVISAQRAKLAEAGRRVAQHVRWPSVRLWVSIGSR